MRTAADMVHDALLVEQRLRRHNEGHRTALRAVLGMHVIGRPTYTAGALSRLLGRTAGATTRVIDKMEAAG